MSSGHRPALGIVPVLHDDRDAPLGCSALRELRGHLLLQRAVGALARSGCLGRVLVPVPPAILASVADLLHSGATGLPAGIDVEVVPVPENGPGVRARAVLSEPARVGGATVVVVHDPLYPLASAALVQTVVDALRARSGVVGVVPVRPVTDTLTWVDEDDVVTGTADRQAFRMVCSPQAYQAQTLARALAAADSDDLRARGPEVLPGLVTAAGGRLATVPAPEEVIRIATGEDLVLADAMLQMGSSPSSGHSSW